jgi:molecular chaperone DnaK
MGTTESFKVKSLGQSKTPVDLSSLVMKELKTFVYTGEEVDAAVITIPASFDTIQSNATKEAGYLAGLKHVVLLQEPIAASLAYANKGKDRDLRNSQWLVYDLGGGTFDVALVKIVEGELKIVDHEGDNFLGGSDFDEQIVKSLIVPEMERCGSFECLENELTSESGKYNSLWYRLLHLAEEAKILLSSKTVAEVEFDTTDDTGEGREMLVNITRSDFESIVKPHIDRTADMIRTILTRNSLRSDDIEFVLMVGGATFTPFVRRRVQELLEIPVNVDIDPVTAVVVGAAHFAATREKKAAVQEGATSKQVVLKIRTSYNHASQDDEEFFAAKVEGVTQGLVYRITRDDGGYDSGRKSLSARVTEDLPLQKDAYNLFAFQVFDAKGNLVPTDLESIQIAHGKYSVSGQPVPHDICLVLDDLQNQSTTLRPLFVKNVILSARTELTVTVNRTVRKNSADQILRVMVVEGPRDSIPEANLVIGQLNIYGTQVSRDVPKGSEIDLSVEMSESRDLTISAYITATGQGFTGVFSPKLRHVSVDTLADQARLLHEELEAEIVEATELENYDAAKRLSELRRTAEEIDHRATILSMDDVTDERYKLEDRKRQLAQDVATITRGKKLDKARNEYVEAKKTCLRVINENGNDQERHHFNEIVEQESSFLSSSNPMKIQEKTNLLGHIQFGVLRRTPAFLIEWFQYLVSQQQRFNDQVLAKSLIDAGNAAVEKHNVERLYEVNMGLGNLLPQEEQKEVDRRFTGLSG